MFRLAEQEQRLFYASNPPCRPGDRITELKMVVEALKCLSVQTLLSKQAVPREWKLLCSFAIDSKRVNSGRSKSFETTQELYSAVRRYKDAGTPECGGIAEHAWVANQQVGCIQYC